jgi:hypothetical protein
VAEGVVVVLVRVAGQDAVDAGSDHLQEGVLGQVGVAGVVQGASVGPGEPNALVELADGEHTVIILHMFMYRVDDERRAEKIQALGPDIW